MALCCWGRSINNAIRQPENIHIAWRYGNRKRGARQDARSGKTAFQAALCAANSFYRLTASA
nr:hypothetical protein [uncultured Kingella sp.]